MRKSKSLLSLILVFLIVATIGCSPLQENTPTPTVEPFVEETEHDAMIQDSEEHVLDVVFVNPGFETTYWWMCSEFMKSVAKDLGIALEIIYSDRDHIQMVEHVREVAQRENKPDYLIVVNEKPMAIEMFDAAEEAGINVMLMSNDLTETESHVAGLPRTRYPHWLGVILPDNISGGRLIAETLIDEYGEQTPSEPMQMVAIAGSRATVASIERLEGLNQVLENNDQVNLEQIAYGEWETQRAYESSLGLLRRYPDLNLIWTANDEMALGAIRAIEENGLIPGEDILVSGLNWSKEGLESVRKGEMTASIGGHFIIGGCTLITLYDHYHGVDFAEDEGLRFRVETFKTINQEHVDEYSKFILPESWESIDFKKYSKYEHPEIESYGFSVDAFLEDVLQSEGDD